MQRMSQASKLLLGPLTGRGGGNPELVIQFSAADWTPGGNNTVTDDGTDVVITYVDTATAATIIDVDDILSENLDSGETYDVEFVAKISTGNAVFRLGWNTNVDETINSVGFQLYQMQGVAGAGSNFVQIRNMGVGEIVTIQSFSIKRA